MSSIIEIKDEESLISFVYRLAAKNFYDSIQSFSSTWGIKKMRMDNNLFTDNAIAELHRLTGIEKSVLFERSNDFLIEKHGWNFFDKNVKRNSVKYCPQCIQNGPVHKYLWMLEPVTVCLEHQSVLLDRCQNCKEKISIHNLMNGNCEKCCFQFDQATSQFITEPTFIQSQSLIQNKLVGILQNNSKNIIEGLSLENYMILVNSSLHLLKGLKSFIGDPIEIKSFFTKNNFYENNRSLYNHANVLWMYQDFPVNFQTVLENVFQLPIKNRATKLRSFYCISSLEQFRDLVHEAGRIIDKLNERMANVTGALPSRQSSRKKKRGCQVSKNIVNVTFSPTNDYIRRNEAATILGIGEREQVNNIVECGFLSLYKFPSSQYYLLKNEVIDFLKKYRGKYDEEIQGISFYTVLQKFANPSFKLTDILKFIENGLLTPHVNVPDGKLSDTIFSDQEIQNCIEILRQRKKEKNGISKDELRRLLKVDYRTIIKLEERGILEPVISISKTGRRRTSYYSPVDVEIFQKRYISIKVASERFQIPESKIRKLIYDGRLHDAFEGLHRKYVFHVDDIEKLFAEETG
ncbi:TniQ family protein [Paenibacillus cremeus]|uniref:TniQ domain-containing protein n=1 Tax=Paenibacillus cremeus TaxID=2163881 RepID=A0A559KAG4_9BACL|nr:TniQ family protein [Paenibacillus cremeus]TVY09089.1 hypothetical protein FPZ49_15375 [Paenibacillus cremeus]